MNLLLDTHAFLWHADGNPQMSAFATALLTDPANELFLSMASIWEIAISSYGVTVLPIVFEDCAEYQTLGFPLPNS